MNLNVSPNRIVKTSRFLSISHLSQTQIALISYSFGIFLYFYFLKTLYKFWVVFIRCIVSLLYFILYYWFIDSLIIIIIIIIINVLCCVCVCVCVCKFDEIKIVVCCCQNLVEWARKLRMSPVDIVRSERPDDARWCVRHSLLYRQSNIGTYDG